ncbi:hypothetical protein TorRG33x02_026580 [Trema orientale]|uniref:Uncharacterized protein n=1 Tax=Trema orientale TaxID=63057 RepID=A0A2P5FU90_TREOI|nr:hypothetical protein TorRG33x02_026580 [Trema orientale]
MERIMAYSMLEPCGIVIYGLPRIECCELGSGEEEERRFENEASRERILPWKLVIQILNRARKMYGLRP